MNNATRFAEYVFGILSQWVKSPKKQSEGVRFY